MWPSVLPAWCASKELFLSAALSSAVDADLAPLGSQQAEPGT